jgi:ATP-dependent helicase/nuclease subunit B
LSIQRYPFDLCTQYISALAERVDADRIKLIRSFDWRDAVVLIPNAGQLAFVSQQWARWASSHGYWLPRIETVQTLAQSLGPIRTAPEAAVLTLHTPTDKLNISSWLRQQPTMSTWFHKDPIGFEFAVGGVVELSHAWYRCAMQKVSVQRDDYWSHVRQVLQKSVLSATQDEMVLAQMALEWSVQSLQDGCATDKLFAHPAAAWIFLQWGGTDPMAAALVEHFAQLQVPCWLMQADPDPEQPFNEWLMRMNDSEGAKKQVLNVRLQACDNFEEEAHMAAAQVLLHLQEGLSPIALIDQDRLLVRRIRALLARQDVPIKDESGWKLSTSRQAALVMSLIRCWDLCASLDAWLNALHELCSFIPAEWSPVALQQLEDQINHAGWRQLAHLKMHQISPLALQLWKQACGSLVPSLPLRPRPLKHWQQTLANCLQQASLWNILQRDEAGLQLIKVLSLYIVDSHDPLREDLSSTAEPISVENFIQWVDEACENAVFTPRASENAPVVITSVEKAIGRPFAAVVWPGADDHHFSIQHPGYALISEAVANNTGLPTTIDHQNRQRLAMAHLLNVPQLSWLYRRQDGNETRWLSPYIEQFKSFVHHHVLSEELVSSFHHDYGLPIKQILFRPIVKPAPEAGHLLPGSVSASACETLRNCPYRFYAKYMLGLFQHDDPKDQIEKQHYGSWLHHVLFQFHQDRQRTLDTFPNQPQALLTDPQSLDQLLRFAHQYSEEQGWALEETLPFWLSLKKWASAYLHWQADRETQGWVWKAGELSLSIEPQLWQGLKMKGVIDRIDLDSSHHLSNVGHWKILDYKTTAGATLKRRVANALEDTQLAFYVALWQMQFPDRVSVSAAYVALDSSGGQIEEIEHPEVIESAQGLLEGLSHEWQQIRQGHPLKALGALSACEYCEARGLCRRDHWPQETK